MIGNEIEFFYTEPTMDKGIVMSGIVVDAYTKITGSVSGQSGYFLGIGDGSVSGNTDSKRMYKVHTTSRWDLNGKRNQFVDIPATWLKDIIRYAVPAQELNEEKIQP